MDETETRRPSVNKVTVTVSGPCPGCGRWAERQRSGPAAEMLARDSEGKLIDPAPVWHKRCEP